MCTLGEGEHCALFLLHCTCRIQVHCLVKLLSRSIVQTAVISHVFFGPRFIVSTATRCALEFSSFEPPTDTKLFLQVLAGNFPTSVFLPWASCATVSDYATLVRFHAFAARYEAQGDAGY